MPSKSNSPLKISWNHEMMNDFIPSHCGMVPRFVPALWTRQDTLLSIPRDIYDSNLSAKQLEFF